MPSNLSLFPFLRNTIMNLQKNAFKFKFIPFFAKYYNKLTGKRLLTNIFLREFPGDFGAGHST